MLGGVLRRLYALGPRGARYDLDSMRAACAAKGDPQDAFPTVHVAGTNGKGSVAATLEAIARAAGLRTGLYTSPHLVRFAERIRIDGEELTSDRLEEALGRVLDDHPTLTFFEVATLAAFETFRDEGVDLAVIEVGLGGRLDATNVVARPLASVVTSIALDHTEILGDTIEAIAAEKAGILRPGVGVVTGDLPAAAEHAVAARAREVGAAPLLRLGREIERERDPGGLRVASPFGRMHVTPGLRGPHQDDNAAIAVTAALLVRDAPALRGPRIDARAIERGVSGVRWPGRFEEVRSVALQLRGPFLLDGAHNEEGARALARALDDREAREVEAGATRGVERRPRALVFGAMRDKPWEVMLRELAPRCAARFYVEPVAMGGARSATPRDEMAAGDSDGVAVADLGLALEMARARVGEAGEVVVAGSLYLVGQARALLLGLESDPPIAL